MTTLVRSYICICRFWHRWFEFQGIPWWWNRGFTETSQTSGEKGTLNTLSW